MELNELASYLDDLLRSEAISDYPNALNGVQVENIRSIQRIAFAVDASLASIEAAIEGAAELLIVHHGLFWGGNQPLRGPHFQRIRALVEADVALYSSHLPLDLHPIHGNNAVLARALGIRIEGGLESYQGQEIGIRGRLEIGRKELAERLESLLESPVRLIPGGPEEVIRVGVITGAGASQIATARKAGLDSLITGEASHQHFFDAMEGGLNLYLGGHYATETWGLRSLAAHLAESFGLETFFIDQPTGF